jgi:hypothetical protein
MEKSKYRNALSDILGNVVGEEGVKIDVNLSMSTIPIIVVSVVAAIIIGSVASHYIIKAIDK